MASTPIERGFAGLVPRSSIVVLLALSLVGLLYMQAPDREYLATYFLLKQDIPALAVIVLFAILLRRVFTLPAPLSRLGALMNSFERIPVWAISLMVALIGCAGGWLVFSFYPLSMDEFWARADGQIFAHGAPMAHIPAQWLPFAPALQPFFLRLLPEAGLWSSSYLPVNALIQMALGPFASPLLAAVSVVLIASIARQLMPAYRPAPLIAALLLASSSQLLVTAMTPYAMSAHLAFDLAWLRLFLKRRPSAQFGAMVVGFLASGLHQFVFFPLFAAPFLAERFLSGQRAWPIVHAAVIALGVLAWSNYDGISAAWMGVTPAPGVARDTGQLFWKMIDLIERFDLDALGLMSLNLLRFLLWQDPIALPLVFLTIPKAVREGGPMRAALFGIVLVPMFMLCVLPSQGHGWGYRYLHGELGSVALLATYGSSQIARANGERWRAAFASSVAFSIVVLLPLRSYQAWAQAAPYIAADRALGNVDADIVVIDTPNHAYAWDLVRNSPMLDNTPKRMISVAFSDQQMARLCKRYRVRVFTDVDADRFGMVALDNGIAGRDFTHAGCLK